MPNEQTESSKSLSKRDAARLAAQARRAAKAKKASRAERAYFRWTEKTYGVTEEQYRTMFDAQQGRCAICRRRPTRRRLAVDHDHNTGEVRGLLCYTCNHFTLRYVEGSPVAAHNAAIYIARIAAAYGLQYAPVLDALVESGSPIPWPELLSTNMLTPSSATPPTSTTSS